jgi:hypothetical protein
MKLLYLEIHMKRELNAVTHSLEVYACRRRTDLLAGLEFADELAVA